MPGLITECGRYKAIGQLGFAWRLIARHSVVMYSDMGRRVPAKVIPHWLSILAGTRRSMSDCITALGLTTCWASLCERLRGRHKCSAAVRISPAYVGISSAASGPTSAAKNALVRLLLLQEEEEDEDYKLYNQITEILAKHERNTTPCQPVP